jgi:outer membrane protein assembly factor BamA
LKPDRLEFGGTPVLAGDSDIGVGFGALFSLARFQRGCSPFCWRIEALLMMTAKESVKGGVEFPYHDDYIKLDLPGLIDDRLRLNLELSFGRYSNSGYYGLGNDSKVNSEALAAHPRYHQYDHIYPQLRTRLRIKILSQVQMMLGGSFTYNWINRYDQSQLLTEVDIDDRRIRDLLRGTDHHGIAELDLGWIWDSRDHEYSPTRGFFHELSWRSSPGLATSDDLAYGGLNFTTRFYQSLLGPNLVLAARLMLDLLVGSPPFYELARHGGLVPKPAIGGGVRGVPRQRYHGKVKLLGNLELRAKLLPFTIFEQRFNLGLTAFVDTGRVWADFSDGERFDGDKVGLKVGVGAGLRLQWGETFLLRVDTGWSPDADPIGFYVDINHLF